MENQLNMPREIAFSVLLNCEQHGAWSDGALKNAIKKAKLDARDSALCSRICYGVQQNELLLDFYISKFSKVRLEKLESAVRIALRMGIYQILLMDKIPDRAAVSESVELVKRHSKNPHSANLTNGILRGFCRSKDKLPQPESLSVRYSHPEWLVELLQEAVGEQELESLLAANNQEVPTTIQVNPLITTAVALRKSLEGANITVTPHPWLEGCFTLSGTGALDTVPGFAEGQFMVQDAAAKLAALAAGARPGMKVLDACAAPGGKSFACAMAMENQGRILSCDIHPKKVKEITSGAKRLGIDILSAQIANGKEFHPEWESAFDLVIADVPCSGLGIIRKKPDIRYKNPSALEGLPSVQSAILNNVSRYVRHGGGLLYATCTVLRRENEDVINEFLKNHPDFRLEPLELPEPVGRVAEGMLTLWPHRHGTDGFFLAKLRKV